MNRLFFIVSLILLQQCTLSAGKNIFSGFWEGPHPDNVNKKFYIQITVTNDSVRAAGFWTNNGFFESKFRVDPIAVKSDSIRFFVPDWNCFYLGRVCRNQIIKGGFSCPGEPFDAVNLLKNNGIKRFLTAAKPGCLKNNYKYKYDKPEPFEDYFPGSRFLSRNDSLFIFSLIPEIIHNQYGRINSFLLVKNGNLICEEYFYGYTGNDLHQIESATKSITSLLTGIAKDQGMLPDIQEPLFKLLPSFQHLKSGGYRDITLAHVLSMTSGFSNEYEPFRNYDRIGYALNRKLIAPAGERFIYDGGNTEILGAIIKKRSGMYPDVFAEKFLFKPLGIAKYDWNRFKQNGFPCMGGSLHLLPRDMAKIGLLVLNRGMFHNHQIVSGDWIDESTSFKTETHIPGDNYGYQWWIISVESNKEKYKAIWANGLGSQFIYVFPELDVVIVTTGCNYENDSWVITQGIGKYLYLLDNKSRTGTSNGNRLHTLPLKKN